MRKKEKVSCIYMWEVIRPGKWFGGKYIGQTKDVSKRKSGHFSTLKRDVHSNIKLQHFVNKYGIESLRFSILMKCPKSELNFWEKWFIKSFDTYKTKINFNLTRGGNDAQIVCRECELQNMETGEIVKCSSLLEFSEKYGVNNYQSLGSVLDGKSKYTGVWLNPKSPWRPKIYSLISPDGKIYSFPNVRLKHFCKTHNLETSAIHGLANNKMVTYKGWKNVNGRKYNFHCSKYSFLSPDGQVYSGENLNEFCRDNSLSVSAIQRVWVEKVPHHKGWRKYKEGMVIQPFIFKMFKFVSPQGDIVVIDNMHKLAKKYDLNPDCLQALHKEKFSSHKGWTKYKETN